MVNMNLSWNGNKDMNSFMRNKQSEEYIYKFVILLCCYLLGLILQGAIPFFGLTTLGQSVAVVGYPISFLHQETFSLYASHMGFPSQSPMSTMLAPALVMEFFLFIGASPANSISLAFIVWYSFGFLGLCSIAAKCKVNFFNCAFLALLWMSFPIIWNSKGYIHLHFGFVFFPFLFYVLLSLIDSIFSKRLFFYIFLYVATVIVLAFTDGYVFMFAAVSSSIFFVSHFIFNKEIRRKLFAVIYPVHVVAFLSAYILFSSYIGMSEFESSPIDFFRGWGMDLSFALLPTSGVHWFWDLLGFSTTRLSSQFFGDSSVWITTFILPLFAVVFIASFRLNKRNATFFAALAIGLFSFYMSLGPSVKFFSTKKEYESEQRVMKKEQAIFRTGSAILSTNIPGFRNMRASYRWIFLTYFSLWFLFVLYLSGKSKWINSFLIIGLFLLYVPNIQMVIDEKEGNYNNFKDINHELLSSLREKLSVGEIVAFLPNGNDFFVNYLAPALNIKTYNIGGDKNVTAAQLGWPPEMLALGGKLDAFKAPIAVKMLIDGTADVLVLPYFDMLKAAHYWPCGRLIPSQLNEEQHESSRRISKFVCLSERKAELQSFIATLRESPYVEVSDSELFATVRLRPEFSGEFARAVLRAADLENIRYPILLNSEFDKSLYVLREGWYPLEAHHVWSRAVAKLALPIPKGCEKNNCFAVLKFGVFGASPERLISVNFNSAEQGWQWSQRIVANSADVIEVNVPLAGTEGVRRILISIPEATSPNALNLSVDARVLGIALQRIELLHQ